jgi:hypothetical protein
VEAWRRLRRTTPELLARPVSSKALLNSRRPALGKDPVWLTRHARGLVTVVDDQLLLRWPRWLRFRVAHDMTRARPGSVLFALGLLHVLRAGPWTGGSRHTPGLA